MCYTLRYWEGGARFVGGGDGQTRYGASSSPAALSPPSSLFIAPFSTSELGGRGGGSSRRLIATLQRVRSRDNQKEREAVLLPRRTRRRKRPNSAKTERNLLRPSQLSTLNRRIPSRMGPGFSVRKETASCFV